MIRAPTCQVASGQPPSLAQRTYCYIIGSSGSAFQASSDHIKFAACECFPHGLSPCHRWAPTAHRRGQMSAM
eukprot:9468755-Pyramimonas_sp.AAC.1